MKWYWELSIVAAGLAVGIWGSGSTVRNAIGAFGIVWAIGLVGRKVYQFFEGQGL